MVTIPLLKRAHFGFVRALNKKYDAMPGWADSPDPSVMLLTLLAMVGTANNPRMQCGERGESYWKRMPLRYAGP